MVKVLELVTKEMKKSSKINQLQKKLRKLG